MKVCNPFHFPKKNNLDLLRLIFAVQVIFQHSSQHLGSSVPGILKHFPGVPAFFFVSGFLIYSSYQFTSPTHYFKNRCLRLFPALFFVAIGGVLILWIAKGWGYLFDHFPLVLLWFCGQITIFQAFNPSQFNDVGVGVINGVLWTITTEILFYLFIPLLVICEKTFRHSLFLFILASFFFYAMGEDLLGELIYADKSAYDYLCLTPVVWGWMFGLGILSVKYFHFLKDVLPYLVLLVLPMVWIIHGEYGGLWLESSGNKLGLLYFIFYSGLILWAAFFLPPFLIKFDLSYGLYIWHMPIINLLLILKTPSIGLALSYSLLLALASWFIIEKNAIKFKKSSLKNVL